MKYRIASLILAILLGALAATQVFAYEGGEEPEQEQELEIETAVEEQPEPEALFYLDGEPLYDVVAEKIGNTYYVTLRSILPWLDPASVVEEEGGVTTVTSQLVEVIEPALVPAVETVAGGEAEGTEETKEPEGTEEPEETETPEEAKGPEETEEPGETEEPEEMEAPEEAEEPEETEEPEMTEAVVEVLDTLTMTAAEGEEYVVANGRYLYVKDGVATLDGAAAVPVRILGKIFGAAVWYDEETERVHLTSAQQPGYLTDGEDFYDEEDLYWLTRVIYCESGNQPLAGKVAVGNVVMNRVADPNFPDTIYDVLFQENQFYNNESKLRKRTPNEESAIAAMLALDGGEALDNVLFFNRVGLTCFASKHRTFVATIGGHSFYA